MMETTREIYLDNSATTKVCEEAAKAALELMTVCYGNPSSLHTMGVRAETAMTRARRIVAQAMGAQEKNIVFTSGGTESNNLALFGAAYARQKRGKRIVTTAVEHHSVLYTAQQLEKEGFEVIYLKPRRDGHIREEDVFEAINRDTILVSMMAVNNETGAIFPVKAAAAAIKRAGAPALLHVDAVQAFGKLPLRPAKMGIDLMSISGHKIHAPKGIGALYIGNGVHLVPRVFGGGQEQNIRPGTESVPLIGALGAAVEALPSVAQEEAAMRALNRSLREKLAAFPDVVIHSPEDGLPCILNFSAGTVRAETMLHFLASRGIYVSSGSACAKSARSHVLTAMGLPQKEIDSALRVSFSRYNTEEDVAALVAALEEGLRTLARAR